MVPEKEGITWWTTHLAMSPSDATVPAGIPGHYFVLNTDASFQSVPFIAKFTGGAYVELHPHLVVRVVHVVHEAAA